jgi:hypothetical protein
MKPINQEIIKNLKYVKLSNTKIDLSHFPDFMIIGPQRTGTTWLYKNLREHPQIFLTNPKEIFYFSFLHEPKHCPDCSNDLAWYIKFFYDNPIEYLVKNIRALIKYQEFYTPKVRGEASATYAILPEDIIREIVTLNPDLKVILFIRNPIDRTWAHAKLVFKNERQKRLSDATEKEVIEFFMRNYNYLLASGQYTKIIDKWSSFLEQGNIFVGLFDDIHRNPKELLLRVFDFLGVRSDTKYIGNLAKKRINLIETESFKIPEKYRKFLWNMFKDELEKLKELEKKFSLSQEKNTNTDILYSLTVNYK